MGIKVSEFGKTSKGKIAHIYTLVNGKGMALEVTDYGATMVSILAPDAKGRSKDVPGRKNRRGTTCPCGATAATPSSEETETGQKMHRS